MFQTATGSGQGVGARLPKRISGPGKRVSYYTFLAISLPTIAALGNQAKSLSWAWFLGTVTMFLLGGALVYLWAQAVDRALEKEYAEFWHNCRSSLRRRL
jgi:hypothetical protein